MKTDYETQAETFLNKWGIELSIRPTYSGKCPPFCDGKDCIHGVEHCIKLARPLTGKRLQFPFWNSFSDAQTEKEPTAYDVLACIASDLNCPESFEEFCSEYGYETDSRKAHATWKRCSAFGKKLVAFFGSEEMALELQQIN